MKRIIKLYMKMEQSSNSGMLYLSLCVQCVCIQVHVSKYTRSLSTRVSYVFFTVAVAQERIDCHLKGFSLICLPITLTVLAAGDYLAEFGSHGAAN